jgi:predicted small lipoprotein YifL
MLQHIRQILVSTSVLAAGVAALAGCGQKGALTLPTEPAAVQRATLLQSMRPATATSAPRAGTSAPRTP